MHMKKLNLVLLSAVLSACGTEVPPPPNNSTVVYDNNAPHTLSGRRFAIPAIAESFCVQTCRLEGGLITEYIDGAYDIQVAFTEITSATPPTGAVNQLAGTAAKAGFYGDVVLTANAVYAGQAGTLTLRFEKHSQTVTLLFNGATVTALSITPI
jgi:hypothetical protein